MSSLWPSSSSGRIDSEVEIPRLCSSGSKSDAVLPSSTRPMRWRSPLANNIASARVVFPELPCPTRATLRILAVGKFFTPASGATVGPPVTYRQQTGGQVAADRIGRREPGRRLARRYTQRDARERVEESHVGYTLAGGSRTGPAPRRRPPPTGRDQRRPDHPAGPGRLGGLRPGRGRRPPRLGGF